MKLSNPVDRHSLRIKKSDYVLEVGSGHNPTYRANVIVDKYIDSNYHRDGDLRIYPHQTFVNSDGENLPFKDKEFDYVISNQTLEHTDNPSRFIAELQRVAKRGYVEVPSLVGESLFPKESHKWLCLEINNKMVFYEKDRVKDFYPDFGRTFLNNLPYQSIALWSFYICYPQANSVRYEWKDEIDHLINPEDTYYSSFFTDQWNDKMSKTIFPVHSKKDEFKIFFSSFAHILKIMIKRRVEKHVPISLEEYEKLKNSK